MQNCRFHCDIPWDWPPKDERAELNIDVDSKTHNVRTCKKYANWTRKWIGTSTIFRNGSAGEEYKMGRHRQMKLWGGWTDAYCDIQLRKLDARQPLWYIINFRRHVVGSIARQSCSAEIDWRRDNPKPGSILQKPHYFAGSTVFKDTSGKTRRQRLKEYVNKTVQTLL